MAKKVATPTSMSLIYLFCTNTGKKNYATYLNSIEKLAQKHGTSLVSLVKTLTSKSITDPMSVAMAHFTLWTAGSGKSQRTIQNWRVAFKAFMEFHLGQYYGHIWLYNFVEPCLFCEIVAKSAIFASPDVVRDVVNGKLGADENKKGLCSKVTQCNTITGSNCMGGPGNPYASWDHCVHARDNNVKKGNPTTDCHGLPCIADDNTYANKGIKDAIKEKYKRLGLVYTGIKFSDYVACHIWDNPDDCHYYTSIANLVLVPRAIYGLTDHCEEVKTALRKRATDLFGGIATLPPISQAASNKIANIYKTLKWREP